MCGHPLVRHVIDSNRFQRRVLCGCVSTVLHSLHMCGISGVYREAVNYLNLLKYTMLSSFHLNKHAEYIFLTKPYTL